MCKQEKDWNWKAEKKKKRKRKTDFVGAVRSVVKSKRNTLHIAHTSPKANDAFQLIQRRWREKKQHEEWEKKWRDE